MRRMPPRICRAKPYARAAVNYRRKLPADVESLDQFFVTRLVLRLQIVEEAATLRNHLQQTAPGMVILDVSLEVFGQVIDPFRKDCDLHFGRTGVAFLGRVLLNERLLALST